MKEMVGILHPGAMGVSVAASARGSGCTVFWASEGRGMKTRERAEKHGIIEMASLSELCGKCSVIVSVCPPHAAEQVAESVLKASFKGLYVDANAISPQRIARMTTVLTEAGISFVDGGIIGPPAWKHGTTRLYLAGK